jgi:ubiquinone/menaquinone biosynthesis C-methylase UbiE
LILDVGCGNTPRGDVNCDLFMREDNVGRPVVLNKVQSFVLCSAEFLPFKSEAFDKVLCYHVIEHVDNPLRLLYELVRVSRNEIVVRCPHRYSGGAKKPVHKNFFNSRWFKKALYEIGKVYRLSYDDELRVTDPLRLGFDLRVTINRLCIEGIE